VDVGIFLCEEAKLRKSFFRMQLLKSINRQPDFACPKTEAGRNQIHSVVRLSKFSEDQAHVMHAQHSRDRSAPAALPYEFNGVDVAYLPPPSMLEHKIAKGSAGLPLTFPPTGVIEATAQPPSA